MPASEAIRVDGLRELNRAFARADRTMRLEKNKALREAVEVVRSEAEVRAVAEIPRIGIDWSRMRTGVTTKVVYVAPKQRGARGNSTRRRPNLAGKLMDEAMAPALQNNRQRVINELEDALAKMERAWAR